jgi:hypothetical protein
LHSTKCSSGKKKGGNHSPQKKKKNSIQDSVRNEENGCPVPDPSKTMITVTKEPSEPPPYKKNPQRRNLGRNHRETHGKDTRHG